MNILSPHFEREKNLFQRAILTASRVQKKRYILDYF